MISAACMQKKPDKYTYQLLERAFKLRQEVALRALGEKLSAQLRDMAERRLRQKYDPAQHDMPVLEKYGFCSQVEAVNLSVYDPDTQAYEFGRGIGIKLDLPGYKIPGPYSGYVEITLGGYGPHVAENGPHEAHPDHNSADWQLARKAQHLRDTCLETQRREFEEFKRAIRATSSWAKLTAQFPWIKSLTTTDGKTIPAAAVAGLYGGKENSMGLDVADG